jgi:3',5'-cyclic AMP phosphodiesterase CpdA
MLIAQVTDSHVERPGVLSHGRFDSRACLKRALQAIASLNVRPDLILHTGDLTQHGDVAVNKDVRAMLEETGIAYAVIPGNHDDIEPLRQAYADKPWMPRDSRFLHYVLEDYPVRIICLDSKIPGEVAGTLCEERLAWLASQLAAGGNRPTMMAMHHPVFRIGRPISDTRPFIKAAEFTELVAKYPNVSLIIAGHVHCTLQARVAHAVAIAAPSVSFQFAMDRRPNSIIAMTGEPPGYYMHDWKDGFGFTSQYQTIGDFGPLTPLRVS